MKDECLICKAPLEYLVQDEMMECAICHKKEQSKTRCVKGHYVCSECHTEGMDSIFSLCLAETSTDPIEIIRKMMDLPFCHMHGPEHHVMVGAALLPPIKTQAASWIWKVLCEKCTAGANRCPEGPVASGGPAGRVSVPDSLCPSPPSPRRWRKSRGG